MSLEEKAFLTAQEFADKIGVHVQTIRKWDKNAVLKPHHTTPGGHRLYSQEQVEAYFNGEFNISDK